jgi:hypothetical protein
MEPAGAEGRARAGEGRAPAKAAAAGRGQPGPAGTGRRVERYADLAAEIWRRPPRLGTVRLVAVDGPTGSGKTSFAARLAQALGAAGAAPDAGALPDADAVPDAGAVPDAVAVSDTTVDDRRRWPAVAPAETVHLDDLLDGWNDQLTFWPRLEAGVLEPLRRGRPGEHPVYDWVAGRFAGRRAVPVPGVLIIEGVTAARAVIRPELTLSVLVLADRDLRLRRCLERDGAATREPLLRWMTIEDGYLAGERPADRVDRLVDGAPEVGHDPESEYVRYTDISARSTADHAPLT